MSSRQFKNGALILSPNRCYYSKEIFGLWEDIGEHYEDNNDILIAEIDCESYKSICKNFKVRSYPLLIMFKNGVKHERYDGERKKSNIIAYVDGYLNQTKGNVRDET